MVTKGCEEAKDRQYQGRLRRTKSLPTTASSAKPFVTKQDEQQQNKGQKSLTFGGEW